MKNLKDEIMGKNEQIALLEKQITDSIVLASHKKIDNFELSHVNLSFPSSCSFLFYLKSKLMLHVVSCCSLFLN